MSKAWHIARYHEAVANIRWAKEQGWRATQWSIIILGAILAASKSTKAIPDWVYVGIAAVIFFVALGWLINLHSAAQKGRRNAQAEQPPKEDPPDGEPPEALDDHVLYLVLQIVAIFVTAVIVVFEILAS